LRTMSLRFCVVVALYSSALVEGLGSDTTSGENPFHAVAQSLADDTFDLFAETHQPELLYCGAVIFVVSLLIGLYHSRGVCVVVAILSYVGALSSMSMLIRNCYVNVGFKYPQFLTATHFVFTAMVGLTVLFYRSVRQGSKINVPDLNCFLKGLLPVAIAFTLSLGFANNGLLLTNAHFYEMIGSSTPLCTAGIAYLLGRGFEKRLMPPLALITMSLLVIAFGEISLSLLGLMACLGGVVGRGCKSTLQHALMGGSEWKAMDPIEVAVWTSLTCFILMAAWSLASEGLAPHRDILAWHTIEAVLYTCIGASILNIAALFVLRELGPVAQQVVGQLKGVLSVVGAVATFGEQVSLQQGIGYSVLMVGIYFYNKKDMEIKGEKQNRMPVMEVNETTKIQTV